ncbi:hypothetical protein L3X38_040476 [Prunus dulcis]|uniref:Uncharacterized protein n=1 Tax=Prunus dulcis TaxID=3755 RepID=A0AAD4YU49_PRUDU|nr:hypothetical protein L3X38_040476 [Prunus dulcis]
MSKNFNFNKTEFKGNNMKKESYEGSRLGSARSGCVAELSQLLAGGRKTENWNEPSNWGTNSQPARTVDNLKTRTSVISPTRADYPIKDLQQHPVKDVPGSDSSKYLKYPYPSSKPGEPHQPRPRAATRAGSAWVCREISGTEKLHTRVHPSGYRFYSTSGTLYSTAPRSNSDGKWSESASETHGFNPELHGFYPATTVDMVVVQPRKQLEGKESYLFQVTAQLEMAGNVAGDVGSFSWFSRRRHRRLPGFRSEKRGGLGRGGREEAFARNNTSNGGRTAEFSPSAQVAPHMSNLLSTPQVDVPEHEKDQACTSFMISLFKSPMRWAKYPTQPFLSNLFALMAKMRQDWRTLRSPQNTTSSCPGLLSATSFRTNPPIHGVPPINPFPR